MSLCEYDIIYSIPKGDRCEFVVENCSYDYINFYQLHFCVFSGNFFFTGPIFTIFLLILFFLLSDTSNTFLSAALTKIVELIKMNQNLAGVTLLALGNGASDVISSLVASSELDGIEFSIGSLVGSGMFITSFVLGTCVFFGEIQVDPSLFNRDIILFLVALLYLVIISFNGEIAVYESAGFIMIYIINVGLAFWQDCRKKKTNINLDVSLLEKDSLGPVSPEIRNNSKYNEISSLNNNDSMIELTQNSSFSSEETVSRSNSFIAEMIVNDIKNNDKDKILEDKKIEKKVDDNVNTFRMKIKSYYFAYKEDDWEKTNFLTCTFYILVDCPLTVIRSLTIPMYDKNKWGRCTFSFLPIGIFCFTMYIFKLFDVYAEDLYLLITIFTISVILSIVLYLCTEDEKPPEYPMILSLFTFVMSLLWIWFIANILVDLLGAMGTLLGIPKTFLGMTVLTFGNSVCDLALNVSLVKGGYGEMALAGSIAGPLFNLLVGLGTSLLKINFMFGTFHIDFFKKDNVISVIAIFFLTINLIRLLIQSYFSKYSLGKSISFFGFGAYIIFFIIICIITFYKI